MRYALLASSSFVVLALLSYACSSSDDKATTTPDAGKVNASSSSSSSSGKGDDDDVGSTSGTSGNASSTSGNASSSGDGGSSSSSGSTSGSTSGTPFDAGSSGGPENQTTPGTKCVDTDQKEKTPDNNAPAKAQVLTPTTGTAKTGFCGSIEGGTDTTDYWTYTFTVTGQFSYSGAASFSAAAPTLTIIVNNTEYPFNSGSIPVKSGEPVLFKITSATKVDYHIDFNVTQN